MILTSSRTLWLTLLILAFVVIGVFVQFVSPRSGNEMNTNAEGGQASTISPSADEEGLSDGPQDAELTGLGDKVDVTPNSQGAFASRSMLSLYSDPDVADPAYQVAYAVASDRLFRGSIFPDATYGRVISRNRIVEISSSAIAAMLEDAKGFEETQRELNARYDLTFFEETPCVLDTFDLVSERIATWQLRSHCSNDESMSISAWVNKDSGMFGVTLRSEDGTEQNFISIDGEYAAIYEVVSEAA